MANRSYTTKTIKVLFGSSGNQCAHPECSNPIIVPGTEQSDDAVLGQICHIYAVSNYGPRGKPGLTDEERNSPDNLILMCGFHHPLVDKQHKDYPAELLRKWKREHEAKFQKDTAEAIRRQEKIQQLAYTVSLTDQQIETEVRRIRQARHLTGYSAIDKARALAASIESIEFAGGSSAVKAHALAWCAKMLARGENSARAKELLAKSRDLGGSPEVDIANAFIVADEAGSSGHALSLLAPIGTAESRSAMLRIVTNEKGAEGALIWAQSAGLNLSSFDGDGKLNFIMNEEIAGRWGDAYAHVQSLTPADFDETPVLTYAAAQAHLAHVVPEDLRTQVHFHLPLDAARVPLSDGKQAIQDRKRAIELYEKQATVAAEFGAVEAELLSREMALWLRLRDAELHGAAIEVLRESMRDDALMLRRFPLAVQFGLKVDLDAVERRVNERVALTGKGTANEALARLALAMCKPTLAEAVEYIALHRDQLYEFLERTSLLGMEIELLCRSGQVETAKVTLAQATLSDFDERERERLQRMIAEAEGADPAAERRKLYEKTSKLRDLVDLVSFLEQEKSWQDLCPLAETLFDQTHSAEDAFRATRAFRGAGEHRRLLQFLQRIPEITAREDELQSLLAWTLYRDGQFKEASAVLSSLRTKRDHVNDRALIVNLTIAEGQWDTLVGFTTREWERRDQRSAEELLHAGQLAQAVSAPHARDLIVAAALGAPDNPYILSSAYFHASNAGWENDPVVSNWLLRAAEQSGDQGPLKSITMKELFEPKPDWDRRSDQIYKALNAGQITISGAAYGLNQSMIENCLLRPAANRLEADARRRSLVYAFSGARPASVQFEGKRVALDLPSIFTFAQLGLLSTVIAFFERVFIPDQLLVWLFQERQRVTFHQPSRVKDAQFLKRLLADGSLKIFTSQKATNLGLAEDVGFDLATMLECATQSTNDAYVIRSAPVHRVGSVMEEEADLALYRGRLCSCQAVVDALRLKGMITAAEEQRASSFLKLHEKRWATEPRIPDGVILYLDDLSTTYLRTAGVLGKLKAAGFTAYVTKSLDDQDNQLLAYESFAGEQLTTIENIRAVLSQALSEGRVEAIASPERESERARLHAQLNFLATDKPVEAFVVDDRFVNRFLQMSHGNGETPILTSLDVVEHLVTSGVVSVDEGREHRTTLRRSGYTFVPVLDDEVAHYLLQAPLDNGAVVETAELRAIRESAQRLRLAKVVQVPHELAWLNQYTVALMRAVHTVWETESDPKIAAARCEWLLGQLDIRGWASIADLGAAARYSVISYAGILHAVCYTPNISLKSQNDPYHSWVDERVLREIKEREPEIFAQVVAFAVALFSKAVKETAERGRTTDQDRYLRVARVTVLAKGYSPLLRDELLSRPEVVDRDDIETDAIITLGGEGLSFRRSQLFPTIAQAYDRVSILTIANIDGQEWTVKFVGDAKPPNVSLERGKQRLLVAHFALLAPEADARLEAFQSIADQHQLSKDLETRWRTLLTEKVPTDHEIMSLRGDLQNTTVGEATAIRESLESGGVSLDTLVPQSEAYYCQLVGGVGTSTTLDAYVAEVTTPFLAELLAEGNPLPLSLAWLLCSHQSISQVIDREWKGEEKVLADGFAWLSKHGDPISRAGAVEAGLRLVKDHTGLAQPLVELINTFLNGEPGEPTDAFALLSALFSCIYGQMAKRRILATWPPFARRLAALAHASLVCRHFVAVAKDRTELVDWLRTSNESYFVMQAWLDMRIAPRWFPDLVSTDQWKNELFGRVWMAANLAPEVVASLGLQERLIDDGAHSVLKQIDPVAAHLPGPLEGGATSPIELSPQAIADIEARLTGPVDTTAFSALINAFMLFRVPDHLVDLAAEALERCHYQVPVDERVSLVSCVLGLALVAGVGRNTKLREAIHTTLRVSWRVNPGQLSAEETFRVGVFACAAHVELSDWAERVGQFMTELALRDLAPEDAEELHSHLSIMCHLVPELWGTCGQAQAALGLVIGR